MRIKALGSLVFLIFVNSFLFAQSGNPFDINARLKDSIKIKIDSTSSYETKPQVKQDKSYLQIQQEKLMRDNPFNVSHLPLRISKSEQEEVEEKEEKFDTTTLTKNQPSDNLNVASPKTQGGNKFIFWVLFIQILLLTSLIGVNRGFVGKLWRSINNDNFAKLIARDYNNGYSSSFVLLYPVFILSFSLFIYLAIKYFGSYSGIRIFGFFFLAIAIVYIIRHIYHGIIIAIFPFRKNITYYNFTIILFNCMLGLLLIPINLSISYGPHWLSVFAIYFVFQRQ